MRIGSHVSIRNGYLAAAKHAYQIGAKAFQYFPKNPRGLSVKVVDEKDAAACAVFCQENGLVSIAHTPYPTSLCPPSQSLREANVSSVLNDLHIANLCGSIGIVIHFGKYKGTDHLEGYKLMIDVLNEVLAQWPYQTLILIENNAGQGIKMGTTLEELTQVRKLTQYPEKIGFCLDTCHAFASGLWNGENGEELVSRGIKLGYFEHLKAIHLNDSHYPTGSFRDRHANIGRGEIGEKPFQQLLSNKVFQDIPLILETPRSKTYTHHEELIYIKKLLNY